MEAGPGRWVQQGQAGSLVVLAGHFPPSEQAQHGLSQAASGEFDGREGKATTVTMRGLLRGRLEEVPGLEGNAGAGVESGYVGGAFSPAISRTARTTTGWEGPRRGKGAGGREGGTGVWAVGGVAGPARNAGAGGESGPGRGDAQRI